MVNFWTYTCINWLRQLPYVRAWSERYRDRGLVVIGVHTPEFGFEHTVENVQQAAKDMRVEYPIAIDSNYAVWNAFANHYWPALYFVDASGRLRHHRFGEGDYEASERVIQQLLTEAGDKHVGSDLVSVDPGGAELGADWQDLESTESYLGYSRTEHFASAGEVAPGESSVYRVPAQLTRNQWALDGAWTFEREAVVSNAAAGRIVYQFHARDLHLVMGPVSRGASVGFRVRIDGRAPGSSHGLDVDEQGLGRLADQRMHQLIRQPMPGDGPSLRDPVSKFRRRGVRLHVRVGIVPMAAAISARSAARVLSLWPTTVSTMP